MQIAHDDSDRKSNPRAPLTRVLSRHRRARLRPATSWRALVRDGVTEGARNQNIAKLAGHFLRRYVDPVVTLEMMTAWNAVRCRPPLAEGEVQAIVNNIAGREMRRRGTDHG